MNTVFPPPVKEGKKASMQRLQTEALGVQNRRRRQHNPSEKQRAAKGMLEDGEFEGEEMA